MKIKMETRFGLRVGEYGWPGMKEWKRSWALPFFVLTSGLLSGSIPAFHAKQRSNNNLPQQRI